MVHRTLPTHLRKGFTLVEMMVAVAVLVILLVIIAGVTQGTSLAVHQATGKLSTYAAARGAFSAMTQKLGQATLNTYLDYYGTSSDNTGLTVRTATTGSNTTTTTASSFVPVTYGRVSDLQFIVRQNVDSGSGQEVYFQCPAAYSSDDANYQSTQGLLNACGYYVKYSDNTNFLPTLIGVSKLRYRLMQAIEPTDQLQVYSAIPIAGGANWLGNIENTAGATLAKDALPLADNVIALIVWPRLPLDQDSAGTTLAPKYIYDSQGEGGLSPAPSGTPPTQPLWADQLPPVVQVTMVVIDEASATRPNTQATVSAALPNSPFTNVANYATDLNNLETALVGAHINFEVLNSSVVMRESKWSQ